MTNSPPVKINFVGRPKTEYRQNFVKWSFNIGRILIAGVELVALIALGYRFFIDRQIIDLHDTIKRDQLFVSAQVAKEKNYVSIQSRLSNIKKTEADTNVKISIMNDILTSIAAGNFSSTNLTIDEGNIRFEGVAFSIFPVNNFVEKLKANPNVSSISVDDLSSTANGIQFKLNIELKNEE